MQICKWDFVNDNEFGLIYVANEKLNTAQRSKLIEEKRYF
jgi:hypothetical protein